jgi:glutathione S-transferase
MKLYSAWYCPFAQRTWTALLYKGVQFEYVEIDPYDKTDEWLAISRGTGQVPVLIDDTEVDGQISVPGSTRTMEFIDMRFPDEKPSIFPRSASAMVDTGFWLDYQDKKIIPYLYRFLKARPSSGPARDTKRHLEEGIEAFATGMAGDGPFFAGNRVNAVDIAFAPFALRIDILLSHYNQYALPETGAAWERYRQWWDAMGAFGPFVTTSTALPGYTERLIDFYIPYADGGG